MSATRRIDNDAFGRADEVARQIRETVADQLHDLTIERESLGSQKELVERVQQIGQVAKLLTQAHGRELQAREMGLATAPAIRDQREQRRLLRQAVMALGASCGALAVSMDFDEARAALEARERNGRRRTASDEEDF